MSGFELNDDDVLSTDKSASLTGSKTSTGDEVMESLRQILSNSPLGNSTVSAWTSDGVVCKLLTANGIGWRTGKARLVIEFIPDEPENRSETLDETNSPLDDLRSRL